MTWTSPFTAVTGAVITSAGHNTSVRDNLNHLRALLPDPGSSGLPLVASSTSSAAFGQLGAAGIASDAVTTAKILDANVTSAKLAADAVTTAKILDANVTAAKLAAESVTEAKLDALDSPADNEVLTYDSGTGRLEWQALSALGNSVQSGSGMFVPTAAQIPAGYTRYTNLDGRIPVGAGTTFSTTFTENTNYGSAWSFTPLGSVVIVVGGPDQTEEGGSGADQVAADGHSHGISSQTFTGSSTTWTIPSRAVVWITKD